MNSRPTWILFILSIALLISLPIGWSQEADPSSPAEPKPVAKAPQESATGVEDAAAPAERMDREGVEAALRPLVAKIREAKVSRATVECVNRGMIGGQVLSSDKVVYQIASQAPNRFRAQAKGEADSVQLISDGTQVTAVLGESGYFQAEAPENLQETVISLPAPLGPYPEPVLALTLAGVDLTGSFLSDMKGLEVVNRDAYDGVPAVLLRGVQADGVIWTLWVGSEAEKARPLRMKIDLTPVLATANELPENFKFELDFKFTAWRMDGEVSDDLFAYEPPANLRRYESLEDFFQSMTEAPQQHPLLGEAAPGFVTETLDGKPFELAKQQGKVVVLDFWATWCGPCVKALPIVAEVAKELSDEGVLVFAVNVGEAADEIKPFLMRLGVEIPVLLDPDGEIADSSGAEAIPQTVLIGKDGRVEVVHVGIASQDEYKATLTKQLKALVAGEKLAEEEPQPE